MVLVWMLNAYYAMVDWPQAKSSWGSCLNFH